MAGEFFRKKSARQVLELLELFASGKFAHLGDRLVVIRAEFFARRVMVSGPLQPSPHRLH